MIISTVILFRRTFLARNLYPLRHSTVISKVYEKAWISGSSCLTRAAITTEIKRMMKMKNVLSIRKNNMEEMIHPQRRVKVRRIFRNSNIDHPKTTTIITIKQTFSYSSPWITTKISLCLTTTSRKTQRNNGEKNPSIPKLTRPARLRLRTL